MEAKVELTSDHNQNLETPRGEGSYCALPVGCEPAFDTIQAAAYTGLAAAYLEKLRSIGGGARFIRYGRRAVRYRKRDLDEWMTEHERFSTSEPKAA
jgi:hypothetical protein